MILPAMLPRPTRYWCPTWSQTSSTTLSPVWQDIQQSLLLSVILVLIATTTSTSLKWSSVPLQHIGDNTGRCGNKLWCTSLKCASSYWILAGTWLL